MRAFVDSNHAGDEVTRRSRTGFLVFLNSAPVYWWLSKKQTSCETSMLGSEFVAMKQCTQYILGLCYKLRMMGIPCDEPAYVYGDNQSVLCNTMPTSTLKKSKAVAYHFVRKGCAWNEWRTTYSNTHWNVANLLTKPLPSGEKQWRFVRMILHHIFGQDAVLDAVTVTLMEVTGSEVEYSKKLPEPLGKYFLEVDQGLGPEPLGDFLSISLYEYAMKVDFSQNCNHFGSFYILGQVLFVFGIAIQLNTFDLA